MALVNSMCRSVLSMTVSASFFWMRLAGTNSSWLTVLMLNRQQRRGICAAASGGFNVLAGDSIDPEAVSPS
jgi:hypothetical protein